MPAPLLDPTKTPTLTGRGDPAEEGIDDSYVKPELFIPEMNDLVEASLRLRQDEEREWVKAWAFYKGRHWVTWREDQLVEIEQQKLPKMVLNFIMHVVQTRLGHLTKNRPMWTGVPANADEESRNATRLGIKVLEAYHHRLRMSKKITKAILWMLVPGVSFLKVGWDPLAGGQWNRALSGGEELSGSLGDLFCDVKKPHELLPEPGADDLEGTQRVVDRAFLPIGQVLRRWPHLKGKIEPIDPQSREGRAMLAGVFGSTDGKSSLVANRVEVAESWYRAGTPRTDGNVYENGLYAVVVNGKELAEAGPTPEGLPEIPYVRFGEVETDGFYPTSVARSLIDMNKILDVEFSQQEYNRKVLRPKTLIPYQAQIKQGGWDQDDNELVEYFYPYKPEPYTPASLPAHHIEGRNALIGMMKELGGNFDVLGGKAGTDVRSGRMVSYLQEYAGTVLGVVAGNIENAYEELGNMMLQIIQSRVREERMVPLVGANRRMEILAFQGADLKNMSGVWVQTGSALPISRAERADRIEKYIENKWIDPKKGLRMLNLADSDSDVFAEDELDREIADEVIYKLKNVSQDALKLAMQESQGIAMQRAQIRTSAGLPPLPPSERDVLRALKIEAFEFEDHSVIVEQLNRGFRKTRSYRELPQGLRALADAYCDWHTLLAAGTDPDFPEGSVSMLAPLPKPGDVPMGPSGMPSPVAGVPGAPPGAGMPPGAGGVASIGVDQRGPAENGAERREGLPPVRRPPGPGRPR
jgi:hypothetical protein